MAEFNINFAGHIFQDGLNTLRAAFVTASASLSAACDTARLELEAYESAGEWIGERDDDGYIMWDQSQLIENRIGTAVDGHMITRKAFVTAIYHYWERSALSWVRNTKLDHSKLAKRVRGLGYPISDRLDAVWHLNNLLKHSGSKWAGRLHGSWPELLPGYVVDSSVHAQWHNLVSLKDEDVLTVADIVAASGPCITTILSSKPRGNA